MNKYKVVGYEHRAGTSKKSGKPYDMDILHCISETPIAGDNGYGSRVESLTFKRLIVGEFPSMPAVGDVVRVYFDRSGYPFDIEKV